VTSVLVRHASAGDRHGWAGDDRLRPLDARGRRQAAQLVELLRPLDMRRVVSSPYVRCVETVEPLAAALGLPVERDDLLAALDVEAPVRVGEVVLDVDHDQGGVPPEVHSHRRGAARGDIDTRPMGSEDVPDSTLMLSPR